MRPLPKLTQPQIDALELPDRPSYAMRDRAKAWGVSFGIWAGTTGLGAAISSLVMVGKTMARDSESGDEGVDPAQAYAESAEIAGPIMAAVALTVSTVLYPYTFEKRGWFTTSPWMVFLGGAIGAVVACTASIIAIEMDAPEAGIGIMTAGLVIVPPL